MGIMKRKKGYYSISAVAKMFSVHQQTIRLYEKEGLITPKRSSGNTRLFAEEDVSRLEEIIYLTHQLGINLAGVEMILKLKKQIGRMQKEMNKVFQEAEQELDAQIEQSKQVATHSARELLKMKEKTKALPGQITNKKNTTIITPEKNEPEEDVEETWEIEYDE